jgi:hypothetical protein
MAIISDSAGLHTKDTKDTKDTKSFWFSLKDFFVPFVLFVPFVSFVGPGTPL